MESSSSSEVDLNGSITTEETNSMFLPSTSQYRSENHVDEVLDKIIESSQKDVPKWSKTPVRANEPKSRKRVVGSKLHKDKKRARRSMETTKDRLRAMNEDYASKDFGLWVKCTKCDKWRKVPDYEEDYQVPENWGCWMNSDPTHNDCSIREDLLPKEMYSTSVFQPGSIVWAQVIGFPSWPAIVEDDPDVEEFYEETNEPRIGKVAKYHVTFFGDEVSRAWVSNRNIHRFKISHNVPPLRGKMEKFKSSLKIAFRNAKEAMGFPMKDRLLTYGFAMRYNGRFPTVKDSSLDSESEEDLLQNALNETQDLLKEIDALDDDFNDTRDVLTDEEDKKLPGSSHMDKKFRGTVKPTSNPRKKDTKNIEKSKRVSKKEKNVEVKNLTKHFNKNDFVLKKKKAVQMNLKRKSDLVEPEGKTTELQDSSSESDSSLSDDIDIQINSSSKIPVAPLEKNVIQNESKRSFDSKGNSLLEDSFNGDKETNDEERDDKDDSDQEGGNAKLNDQESDHEMKIVASTKETVAKEKYDNEGTYNGIAVDDGQTINDTAPKPVMTNEDKNDDKGLNATPEESVKKPGIDGKITEESENKDKTKKKTELLKIKSKAKKRKITESTGNLEGSDFEESFENSVDAMKELKIAGADEKSAKNKKMKTKEPSDFKKPGDTEEKNKTSLIDSMPDDNNSANNEKITVEHSQMEQNIKVSSEKDDDKRYDAEMEDDCKVEGNEDGLQLDEDDTPEVSKEVCAGKSATETNTSLKGTVDEKQISKDDIGKKSGQKMTDVEYDTKVGGNEKRTKKETDASLKTGAKMKKAKQQKAKASSSIAEGKGRKEMKQNDDSSGKQNEVSNVKGEIKPKKNKKDGTSEKQNGVPNVKGEMKPKKSKKDQINHENISKPKINDKQDNSIKEVEKSKSKDLPKHDGKEEEKKKNKSVPDFTRRNKPFKPPVMKSDSTATSKNADNNQTIASKQPGLPPAEPKNAQTNNILVTDIHTDLSCLDNDYSYSCDMFMKKNEIKDDVKDKQEKVPPLEEHLLDLNDVNPISMDSDLGLYFYENASSVPSKEIPKKNENLPTSDQKCNNSTSFNLLESDLPAEVSSILYHSASEDSNPFDYD